MIFSVASVVIGFERRRGGAEQGDGAFQARAIDGGVAAVVARSFFLLVAGFLFFIHDDQAEIFQGRENGGARADDYAGLRCGHATIRALARYRGALWRMATRSRSGRGQAADPEG